MSQNKPRFSKANLAQYVGERVNILVREHKIDTGNGTSQCVGKSLDFARAYGRFSALRDLWDEFELPPPLLDLRTLPVGTVCEAVEPLKTVLGSYRSITGAFTITERDDGDTKWPVRVATKEHAITWIAAMQPARVISKPEPAPEPFREGLPALALRRAHRMYEDRGGDVLELTPDGLRGNWVKIGSYAINVRRDCDVSKYDEDYRPHGATWLEVETKAARMLGRCLASGPNSWLRDRLGITDPTRDMTALWAAFREGQKEAIKLAREELGWSQSECAKQAGVPVHRMRAFERGGKVPREYKRKIIVALQTEPPPEKPKQKRAWKKTGG